MVRKIYSQKRFRMKYLASQHLKTTNSTSMTVMMFAVCLVFLVTTLPSNIVYLLRATGIVTADSLFFIITLRIDNINHSVNFILYCVTGTVFRQALVQLFTCHCKKVSTRYVTEQCPTVEGRVWYSWFYLLPSSSCFFALDLYILYFQDFFNFRNIGPLWLLNHLMINWLINQL